MNSNQSERQPTLHSYTPPENPVSTVREDSTMSIARTLILRDENHSSLENRAEPGPVFPFSRRQSSVASRRVTGDLPRGRRDGSTDHRDERKSATVGRRSKGKATRPRNARCPAERDSRRSPTFEFPVACLPPRPPLFRFETRIPRKFREEFNVDEGNS